MLCLHNGKLACWGYYTELNLSRKGIHLMRYLASLRLALLGGTLLWMGVALTSPAHAISTNYTLVPNSAFNGTFTLDPALAQPFTQWSFTTAFGNNYVTGTVFFNGLSSPGIFTLQDNTSNPSDRFFLFNFNPLILTYQAQECLAGCNVLLAANGNVTGQSPSVPEPSVVILLAIGLLALAGSRWLPGRGARQQLG